MLDTSKPGVDIQIDLYSSSFQISIYMFVKQATNNTLIEAIQEDLEFEKEMSSIENKSSVEEPRSSQTVKKEIMKEEKKDKDSFDMDSLQKVIKTTTNEMVDVKGNLVEVSNRPFRPFVKENVKIPPGG
jgi:hypothetical protein